MVLRSSGKVVLMVNSLLVLSLVPKNLVKRDMCTCTSQPPSSTEQQKVRFFVCQGFLQLEIEVFSKFFENGSMVTGAHFFGETSG